MEERAQEQGCSDADGDQPQRVELDDGVEDDQHPFAADRRQQVAVAADEEEDRSRQSEGETDGEQQEAVFAGLLARHVAHEGDLDERADQGAGERPARDGSGVGPARLGEQQHRGHGADHGELALHGVDHAAALEDGGQAHADEGVDDTVRHAREDSLQDQAERHAAAATA